jgi:hypothetical protein
MKQLTANIHEIALVELLPMFHEIAVRVEQASPSVDEATWTEWAGWAKKACAISQSIHFRVAAERAEAKRRLGSQAHDALELFVRHALRLLEAQPKPQLSAAIEFEKYTSNIDKRLLHIDELRR